MGVTLLRFEQNPASCQAEFALPEHVAMFRDHFPNRPLLPAIGLIWLCHRLLACWLGDGVRLAGLKRVRFSAPVLPGAELTIRLERRGAARLRMTARSTAGEHASGELTVDEPTATEPTPPNAPETA